MIREEEVAENSVSVGENNAFLVGGFVIMVHADVRTGTVPSVSPLFIFIPYIYVHNPPIGP